MGLIAGQRVADHDQDMVPAGSSAQATVARCRDAAAISTEGPRVLQRRDAAAGVTDERGIDLGQDHAGLGAALGQHAAPRIDDQRVAEGLAAVLVHGRPARPRS